MVTISGRVSDSRTGSPVPHVSITLNGSKTDTDIAGVFQFQVQPGSYELRIRSPAHRPVTVTIDAMRDQSLTFSISRNVI